MIVAFIKAIGSFQPSYLFSMLTGLAFICIGAMNAIMIKPEFRKDHYTHYYQEESTISLTILEELNHSEHYFKYLAEITTVDRRKCNGKVILRLSKKNNKKGLYYDDILITSRPLKRISKVMNPGAFDFRKYAKRKGLFHQIDLGENDFIRRKTNSLGFKIKAVEFRERIIASLRRHHFSKDEFSVIIALLLGKKQDLSRDLKAQYKNAGAIHILAISGLHVGILMMIINLLLRPLDFLKSAKKLKPVILLIGLWGFAFISGLSASVLRAVSMFSAVALGMFSNRVSNISNYLFISLFFLLLIYPLYLFDVGFQLSYVAVFSIVGLTPLFRRLWKPKHKIVTYFWKLLMISFAAQIGILPLSLFYFHQFSTLFFVSSLVIIPFLGIILGLGFLTIILDQANLALGVFMKSYGFLIRSMNEFIRFIAGFESFVLNEVYFTGSLLIVSFGILLLAVNFLKRRSPKKLIYLLSGLVCLYGVLLYGKVKTQMSTELIIFHQIGNTVIGLRTGGNMTIYGKLEPNDQYLKKLITSYQDQYYEISTTFKAKSSNLFRIEEMMLLVIDSNIWPDDLSFSPDMILLKDSPNLNLERLIERIKPAIIIADGSNYKSYSKRWKHTCSKLKVKFYDTAEKGAFMCAARP